MSKTKPVLRKLKQSTSIDSTSKKNPPTKISVKSWQPNRNVLWAKQTNHENYYRDAKDVKREEKDNSEICLLPTSNLTITNHRSDISIPAIFETAQIGKENESHDSKESKESTTNLSKQSEATKKSNESKELKASLPSEPEKANVDQFLALEIFFQKQKEEEELRKNHASVDVNGANTTNPPMTDSNKTETKSKVSDELKSTGSNELKTTESTELKTQERKSNQLRRHRPTHLTTDGRYRARPAPRKFVSTLTKEAKESDDIKDMINVIPNLYSCPYDDCHAAFHIAPEDINCKIFRCGYLKQPNGTQIMLPPHMPENQSKEAMAKGLIVQGCGRPFELVNGKMVICTWK